MNAAVTEMHNQLWLKDEKLKQLKDVVFDSATDSEQPHQESKAAAVEAPLQQKSDSSSTPHVCFVDNALNLLLTSFPSITSLLSCVYLWLVY